MMPCSSSNWLVTFAKLLMLIWLVALLVGCGTTTGSGGTRAASIVACRGFEPIRWSSRDTDETIRAVKGHNAAYRAVCREL